MFDYRFLITDGVESDTSISPFSMFTPEVKFSFSALTESVYKGFTKITKTAPLENLGFTPYTNDGKLISEFTDSGSFLDMNSVNIVVPAGFEGSLLHYSNLLLSMFTTLATLDDDVLKPTQEALSQTIGSKQQMGIIAMDTYRRDILLHTQAIDAFKADIKTFFNPESTGEVMKFTEAFDRFKDLELFSKKVAEIISVVNKAPTADISKRIDAISKTANKLNLRVKQGKLEHLRNTQAEFISELLVNAAQEVELYAALLTMIEQLISVHKNLLNHLKTIS